MRRGLLQDLFGLLVGPDAQQENFRADRRGDAGAGLGRLARGR